MKTQPQINYRDHTYKINRDTGYVEVDGQPVTVTNGDPELWARQYIDKTVALLANKAQQPQHSPLPWETGNKDKWVYVEGHQNPIVMLENPEDAKLIVASVNHADKLAEALRKLQASIRHAHNCQAPQAFPCSCDADALWNESAKTLEAYEAAK